MIVDRLPFAALEFASLPMLGWIVAAAVPWLIHRWARQHHRTTSWAAIDLLLTAMQHRARRVRLEQWLLLAVRTAIVALVVFAVAEPSWRQWASAAIGDEQTHRIIVVDQSYSMGARQQATSRWQRGRALARGWIEGRQNDATTLIGWSSQVENLTGRPTLEPSVALAALEALELTPASGDLPTALRAVLAAIDRAEAELPQIRAQHVVICTDLSRGTWSGAENARPLLEEIAARAQVTIENVANPEHENIAVASLSIDPTVTLQQHEAVLSATLVCFGAAPTNPVGVDLRIEGRTVQSQQVELQSDGETVLKFPYHFLAQGAQTAQIVIADSHDPLISDDTRWLTVNVRPRLRVACLADQPATTEDLARALAPPGGLTDKVSAIEPELLSVSRLGQTKLSNYAAVLIGSDVKLLPREVVALSDYVRQGGGLAVFLGPETSRDSLSEYSELLPTSIDRIQPVGEYLFDPQEYRHAIVGPFRGQSQSGLRGVDIRQYWRLHRSDAHPAAETVIAFDTGDPALVIDRVAAGRVAVSALPYSLHARTANGALWSSFALDPSFLPVVRELVAYLVGNTSLEQRNLVVGQPAVFQWRGQTGQVTVRLPTGERSLLRPTADDLGQVVFRETDAIGEYRFSANEQELERITINLDGRDSDLRSIDQALLPDGFFTNRVTTNRGPMSSSFRSSLVRALLAAAGVLMLFETGLAWQLGRRWG